MGCSVIFRGIDPCDHPTMCLRGHENTIMSPVTKSNGDGRKGKVVHDDAGERWRTTSGANCPFNMSAQERQLRLSKWPPPWGSHVVIRSNASINELSSVLEMGDHRSCHLREAPRAALAKGGSRYVPQSPKTIRAHCQYRRHLSEDPLFALLVGRQDRSIDLYRRLWT